MILHLLRMKPECPVNQTWEAKIAEKRTRGWPVKTLNYILGKIFYRKNLSWTQAKQLTRDKKKWKKFVHNALLYKNPTPNGNLIRNIYLYILAMQK